MRVFVTGASGFLGKRVVARLVAAGHEPHVLIRNPARYEPPAGVEVVEGALETLPDWAEALTGCDVVVHAAASISMWAPWDEFDRLIVRATAELLAAADVRGVRRFIQISSDSVLQDGKSMLDVDDHSPVPGRVTSRYAQAKQLAERCVLDYRGGIERVVLRPTFIWGPESAFIAGFIERARSGEFPLLDHGRASFEHVHVDNVAHAVSLALTRGSDQGCYLITNQDPRTVGEFFGGILDAFGETLPDRSTPSTPLLLYARVLEGLWRGLRLPGRPPLTRLEIEFFTIPKRYRADRATEELGYQPEVSYSEGVAALVPPERSDCA